ncbi:MAG: hypothetical protein AB7L36_02260 [Sphingomonadaceae bacterium]
MSRAMDKMEAEQAQSDVTRAAVTRAESDAAENKALAIERDRQSRDE